jgi:hypothetical protein
MGASEVICKLLRIGSNGLYTRKNIPATSHQLAHLTGTSVEPQLGLKPKGNRCLAATTPAAASE